MRKKEKIISLNDFKENRKSIASDGTPYTGVYTDYYDWENDQKEHEEYYKDGKENGLIPGGMKTDRKNMKIITKMEN